MAEIGSAFVSIAPSAKGFGRSLEQQTTGGVTGAGRSLGRTFGKLFVLGAGVIAAAGIGKFLKGSIDEAREAQKVGALTAQVIKSTGGAANITAKQVGNLATSISLKAGVDDEAIQSGANLLLTFKNVRNEAGKGNKIFNQATQAAVDLSAAGFGSVESASKQLGKALNDPIKGITALARSGVTFTEAQKDQIKSLVEGGDTLGAQKIIMKELNSQVGGAAAATATYGEKAKVAFGNIKEQVGTALLPVIDGFFKLFLKGVPTITKLIAGIGPFFKRVGAFVSPLIDQVKQFFSAGETGGGLLDSVKEIAATVQANFIPTVKTLVALFQANVVPVLTTAGNTFRNVILPAIVSLVTYVGTSLAPILQTVVGIIVTKVLPILSSLAQFFYGTLYPAVVGIVVAIGKNLKPVFDQLVASVQSQVLPLVNQLLTTFQKYQPTIQKVIGVVVKVIGKVLEFAAAILGRVLPPAIKFGIWLNVTLIKVLIKVISVVVSVIKKVIEFGAAFGRGVAAGVKAITSFQKSVITKFTNVVEYIAKVPGRIKNKFGNALTMLREIGSNIIEGLLNGIRAAGEKIKAVVEGIINKIPKIIREKMGIASPSKVTFALGEFIMRGLGDGMEVAGKKAATKAEKATKAIRDKIKSQLDSLKSDFASIKDSVSSSFTSGLFDAENRGDFLKNLLGNRGQLTALKAAFKKLTAWGLKPAFLSQLFQSGNAGLILDLAAGTKAEGLQASSLFAQNMSLSNQLGGSVASITDNLGPRIDALGTKLDKLDKTLKHVGKDVGKEVNHAAGSGARSRR